MKYKELITIIKNKSLTSIIKSILHKISLLIDRTAVSIIKMILPLKNNYIILESEGDFTDNIYAFYDYLIENDYNNEFKLIWIVHQPKKYEKKKNVEFVSRYNFFNLKADYYMAVAKFFVFSHPYWFKKCRHDQLIINTSHSVAQLKAPSLQQKKIPFDYLLTCSRYCGNIKKKAFEISDDKLLEIGMPRIDILFKNNDFVKNIIPNYYGQKIILCMETFKHSNSWSDSVTNDCYAINVINNEDQLVSLDKFLCTHNMILINKIHHLQDMSFIKQVKLNSIFFISDEYLSKYHVQSNHLLSIADVLLTDYSSVFYEYLLLNRPIGFIIGDIESYSRGFIFEDPLSEMPGYKIHTYDDLICFLNNTLDSNDEFQNERNSVKERVFKYCDNNNSERLFKWINERR